MDARFADCMRAARSIVTPEVLQTLKAPRSSPVFWSTAAIWLQLAVSWCLIWFGPLCLVWVPFLINSAVTQGMLLWVHEASHFHLRASRSSNDLWSDIFFAGPIGMSTAAYRQRHLSHHANLGTDDDADGYPYRMTIKGARALAGVLLKAASGAIGLWLILDKYGPKARRTATGSTYSPRWLAPAITVGFNLLLLLGCVLTGRWYLYFVVWAYPIIAVAITLNIVRTIAEHQPEDYPRLVDGVPTMMPLARTTVPNWFEKWLMYQANFNYHVEHHLFPSVPQHNLSLLHRRLVEHGFYGQFPGCLQRSGLAKFLELSKNRKHDDFSDPVEDALAT